MNIILREKKLNEIFYFFKVFMDQLNRRFAMDLIIHSAKKALNGQYVFLTPQETG